MIIICKRVVQRPAHPTPHFVEKYKESNEVVFVTGFSNTLNITSVIGSQLCRSAVECESVRG